MARVLMIVAQEGFRDEELLIPREMLGTEGHKIKIASLTRGKAIGSLGAVVTAEISVHEANPEFFDAIVIVGGPGSTALAANDDIFVLLKRAVALKRIIAAICLAPMALANAGVLRGKKATVFRSAVALKTLRAGETRIEDKPVIRDGNILTANGPAAAGEFGKQLIDMLKELTSSGK
jgi:protease I